MSYLRRIVSSLLFVAFFISALSQEAPRLVIDPLGHSGKVNDLRFSKDGSFLISVSDDKTIRVWSTRSRALVRTIRLHSEDGNEGRVYAADLSPDGRYLAVGGYFKDNVIRIIDLQHSGELAVLRGHQNIITRLRFSKDGSMLASASTDNTVKLWSLSYSTNKVTGALSKTLSGHSAQVYDIAFAPDGKRIVSASYDGSLILWHLDPEAPKDSELMRMHIDKVFSTAFSPDGEYIISGGNKGKIIRWDKDGHFSKSLADIQEPVFNLTFAPDGSFIAGGFDAFRMDLETGTIIKPVATGGNGITAVSVHGDKYIATAEGLNGGIVFRDYGSGEILGGVRGNGVTPQSIGFGNMQLAVGYGSKSNPLEKAFDLNEIRFLWDKFDPKGFSGSITSLDGYQLIKVDDYTLSTGFSGSVKNNPGVDGRIRSYTILDENRIAIGSDFSLKIYDREGNYQKALKGHNGRIIDVTAANNARYVAAACGDQTLRIWDIESGRLLASFFIARDNEWISWIPSGHYQASAGGERYLGWQVDNGINEVADFYKASSFRSQFHRPDVVIETLRIGSFKKAWEKVGEQQPTPSPSEITEAVPQIDWISPELYRTEVSGDEVIIKARVQSKSKINSIKVLVNGKNAPTERALVPVISDGFTEFIEQRVGLINEVNEIQVFVRTESAKITSEARIITSSSINESRGTGFEVIDYRTKPDLYVLSIGISKFVNSEYDLNYAHKDAETIADIFDKQREGIYNQVMQTRLLDEDATRTNILEAFEWLKSNARNEDVVLIFIATHGFNVRGRFHLLPHDGNAADIAGSTVNWEHLTDLLGNLPSKVLLFMDACHSGQLGTNMLGAGDYSNTEAIREMSSEENGVVIMSASTGDETAQERSDWEHGAFTLSIVEGLRDAQADIKSDGIIFLRELDFYVSERTNELTQGRQHPTTQKPSSISRFAIKRVIK